MPVVASGKEEAEAGSPVADSLAEASAEAVADLVADLVAVAPAPSDLNIRLVPCRNTLQGTSHLGSTFTPNGYTVRSQEVFNDTF